MKEGSVIQTSFVWAMDKQNRAKLPDNSSSNGWRVMGKMIQVIWTLGSLAGHVEEKRLIIWFLVVRLEQLFFLPTTLFAYVELNKNYYLFKQINLVKYFNQRNYPFSNLSNTRTKSTFFDWYIAGVSQTVGKALSYLASGKHFWTVYKIVRKMFFQTLRMLGKTRQIIPTVLRNGREEELSPHLYRSGIAIYIPRAPLYPPGREFPGVLYSLGIIFTFSVAFYGSRERRFIPAPLVVREKVVPWRKIAFFF